MLPILNSICNHERSLTDNDPRRHTLTPTEACAVRGTRRRLPGPRRHAILEDGRQVPGEASFASSTGELKDRLLSLSLFPLPRSGRCKDSNTLATFTK